MAAPYYTYGGNLLNREKYTSTVRSPYADINGSNIRRYFSSIDTDIYFGKERIDEMVAFDFIVDEKKIPIYGYNNFTPKRIITGQKTIQGSFAINFTQTFNLKLIIDSLDDDSIYHNKYEETQFFCGDDNQALFSRGFDITISYGDSWGEGSYNACSQTLVGCYITSYRQAFDTSGEPILDMYTFIAKDLVLNTDLSMEIPPGGGGNRYIGGEPPTGIEEHDLYRVANNNIETELIELMNYCDEYTDTFGVIVNPTFAMVDGMPMLTLFLSEYPNDTIIKVISAELSITVQDSASEKIYPFNLNKTGSDYVWEYKMKGTEVQVGQKIDKLLKDNEIGELPCYVKIVCTASKLEGEQTIEHDTIILSEDSESIFNYNESIPSK